MKRRFEMTVECSRVEFKHAGWMWSISSRVRADDNQNGEDLIEDAVLDILERLD
jgi:hypothetical protein